jgi:divalent metal cation (Fe/Co/Zn/Cd) transporter
VWRFRHPHGNERAEHRAQLVASTALLVLATLLAASSVERLVTGGTVHPGPMTVGVAAASLVVLPLLAARKYAVAAAVPSAALRTDAHITVVGASTAGLALLGFVLTEAGASWADPVAALLVAVAAAAVGLYERRS